MVIDVKSFILGAVVGYCVLLCKASASVARDTIKKENMKISKEEA